MSITEIEAADNQHQHYSRKQTLQDIKGFCKSHGVDIPDRIKQEYSDILTD